MKRAGWVGLAAVLAAVAAVPLATAEQTRSQQFFKDRLLAAEDVSPAVKDLLRGGGFVDKSVVFRDLTGDEKDDAVLRVHSGGAPGVVAVYVLSTDDGDPDDDLQPVFGSEKLIRAATKVSSDGVVTYSYASYKQGDELCCPIRVTTATLGWDDEDKRFKVVKREGVPGPTPTPGP